MGTITKNYICKNDAAVKTHAAVPEKLTIFFGAQGKHFNNFCVGFHIFKMTDPSS
jgi:hypothetical protein